MLDHDECEGNAVYYEITNHAKFGSQADSKLSWIHFSLIITIV